MKHIVLFPAFALCYNAGGIAIVAGIVGAGLWAIAAGIVFLAAGRWVLHIAAA